MTTVTSYKMEGWRLEDLFETPGPAGMNSATTELESALESFESARDSLSDTLSAAEFKRLLSEYERIARLISRLGYFGSLSFSADTQDQEAQALMARMRQLRAQVVNRTLFFTLWWQSLADEPAGRLRQSADHIGSWLDELRRLRPFTLAEREEQLINLKDVNGRQALTTLYESITNRYRFQLTVDGELRDLRREELMVYARSPQPQLRAGAYIEQLRVYGNDEPILGQIYQSIVRDWRSENIDIRGFNSPIAVRNMANNIPDEAVDVLLDTARENRSLFQRFFRLKAKTMGMDQLRRYDIYAAVSASEKRYAFDDAVQLVLESYGEFDAEMAMMAERVFAEQHYDSEVRPGKRGGAFCASVLPGMTPYVLQTYNGTPGDVSTMAHELGHAIHSMLAADHSMLNFQSSLPLAETASTFGEMLLTDKLLSEERDLAVRRDVLYQQMDGQYATIMRQAYFALFERDAHDLIHQGGSVDDVAALYLRNLEEQFDDSVAITPDFRSEWVAIPHIYVAPFYVYAYAFGQLLVLSLYQQYRQEGASFIPRYRAILAAGGSEAPETILRQAGVDIRAASFWQGGFDVVADMLRQLEELETG